MKLQNQFDFSKLRILTIGIVLISIWWSKMYWISFFRPKVQSILSASNKITHKVISKNTYILDIDSIKMDRTSWVRADINTFRGIKLPQETIDGIKRIKELPIVMMNSGDLKVLNMSELTQLIIELPYKTEKDATHPLWYHQGVSFFKREEINFCKKIKEGFYDIILFQSIPELNNFYPYLVKDCITDSYNLEFSFLAPRIPETSKIGVYVKKKNIVLR